MNVIFSVFVFVLFFVLTPGVLLRLPSKGSKTTIALLHGLIFAIILTVSGHLFWKYKKNLFEGATTNTKGLRDKAESIATNNTSNPGSSPGSK